MVLKRKLPSAMAKEAEKKEEGAVSASSAAPTSKEKKKVSFDEFADEVPAKTPPLAPEPEIEISESAIPESSSKLSEENTFQERHLPEDDFSIQAESTSTNIDESEKVAEPTIDSWAEEPDSASGWELDDLDDAKTDGDDVFGSMAAEEVEKEQVSEQTPEVEKTEEILPPWQQGAEGSSAPELPAGTTFNEKPQPQASTHTKEDLTPAEIAARGAAAIVYHDKAKPVGALVAILLLVGIGFGGYSFFVEKDETTEIISRWTGSLNEVSEEIPSSTGKAPIKTNTPEANAILQPEAVVDMAAVNTEKSAQVESVGDLMVPEEPDQVMEDEIPAMVQEETVQIAEAEKAQTVVEFVDVPEEDVEKPIDAEGAPEMPEEVGVIVQLQQAIEQARQEKNPEDFKSPEEQQVEVVEEDSLEKLTPAEIDERNKDLSMQLEEELAEYRKILSGESNEPSDYKPTPNEFFSRNETEEISEGGAIPLPERQSALLTQQQAESLYGANPYNLPVVPEPSYKEDDGVRTLEEFDVSMFQVERERVRIPRNIRPSFRATNFPPLILLSTIPKKGIIAELNSKQGVLLVGESVSGWELLSVKQEYAEFSNGKRKHIVSLGR